MVDTVTPTELARRWRVTTDHLYREVLGRDWPAVQIGNGPRSRWRIFLADIEDYESTDRDLSWPCRMITKLSDKKWRLDFQPSRQAPRIRRTIVGPRALAEDVLLERRKRSIASIPPVLLCLPFSIDASGVDSVGG
jgi:hypothetical protein